MTWPDSTAGEQTLLPAPLSLRRSARKNWCDVVPALATWESKIFLWLFLSLFRKATNWTVNGSTRPAERNASIVNLSLTTLVGLPGKLRLSMRGSQRARRDDWL